MYTVTRRFEFEAAHRLVGYKGKCKHLHGHSYVAEVTVQGDQLDKLGMLVDFGELKRLVGGWIDDNWDHNILLSDRDPFWEANDDYELNEGRIPFTFLYQLPTAEIMAKELYNVCVNRLSSFPVKVTKVRIQETTDCWAEYYDEQPTD